jgi:hypothetical protein
MTLISIQPLIVGQQAFAEGFAQGIASRPAPPEPARPAPDALLRLEVAAKLAFPDGSITAKALHREARKGRLAFTRIAGKTFTTLEAIAHMGELCRVEPNNPASCLKPLNGTDAAASSDMRHGLSGTREGKFALDAARARLRKLASPQQLPRRVARPGPRAQSPARPSSHSRCGVGLFGGRGRMPRKAAGGRV